ncbi:MAG: VanZ family protein [Kangiellaceae bacterium]|jgi:glycopeptide antibiotics resistance protein|nr:VanZ family protein [Kangiellaceae bacterium]
MRVIFLLIAALIVYGSLFPFNFNYSGWQQVNISDWLSTFYHRTSRGDITGNVLMFIPLGFFGMLALLQDGKSKPIKYALPFFLATSVFALSLQLGQLFLSQRVASVSDAVVNALGLMIGIFCAYTIESKWLRDFYDRDDVAATITIPLIICVSWIAYLWYPFLIYFNQGYLLTGLARWFEFLNFSWLSFFQSIVYWLMFWLFFDKLLPNTSIARKYMLYSSAWVVIMLGEGLLINNQTNSATFMGSIVALTMAIYRCRNHRDDSAFNYGLLVLSSIFLIIDELSPYSWTTNFSQINLIPFSYFLNGDLWFNSYLLFKAIFIYSTIFMLLKRVSFSNRQAALSLISVLVILELSQMFIIDQQPDITPPIIALLLVYGLSRLEKVLPVPVNS